MVGSAVGNGAISVSQSPGDEDAALAADVHAFNGEVKARNHASDAVRKLHGLGLTHLGLFVRPHDGLAVRAEDWLRVLIPSVELYAVSGAPAGVLDVPDLFLLTQGS